LLKIEKEANELVTRQHIADSGISIKENYTIIFNRGVKGITTKKKVKPMMIMLSLSLAADASKFLVENKVNAVAIDSPSIDVNTDNNFIFHRILLSNDILVMDRESL
jgi:kynurenine formamidase